MDELRGDAVAVCIRVRQLRCDILAGGMAGGSYKRSLISTFFPELLSMNCLMGGMVPVMILAMNWWLVSLHPPPNN